MEDNKGLEQGLDGVDLEVLVLREPLTVNQADESRGRRSWVKRLGIAHSFSH